MTWYFAPRMVSAFIAIIILVVMTRMLGPSEFGRYSLTLLSGNLLFSFSFHWLVISIGRFHYSAEFGGKTIENALGASAALAFCILVFLGVAFFMVPEQWVIIAFFACGYCVCHTIHELGTACLRQYNEGPKFAIIVVMRHVVGAIFAVAFILAGGGYKSAVVAISLGAALTGSYALWIAMRRSGIGLPKITEIKEYFSFGFPLAVVSSSSTFFAMTSQAFLAAIIGMDSAGYFAAAQSLTTRTLGLPMTTLARAVAPSVFEKYETGGKLASDAVLSRYFSFLLLISTPIFVFLIGMAYILAELLFEARFADQTVTHLKFLTLTSFILGLQGAYLSFSFMRSRKTVQQLAITIFALFFHVVISFFMIKMLGAGGASAAFMLSGTVSFFTYYFVGRKIDPIPLPVEDSIKSMVGALTLVLFVILATASSRLSTQLMLLTVGLAGMYFLLVLIRQTAALAVWKKTKKFFGHGNIIR